jgi:hypothetical protein
MSAEWATSAVSPRQWNRITGENPGSRLISQIQYRDKSVYVALGTPNPEIDGSGLYLPSWVLDNLGAEGSGQIAGVEWLTEDAFPEATRIVLRPHDSAFYHADAKEELEVALTRIGVIQQGDTLLIPLKTLGGYEVAFDVITTEPANIVLAQGDEVAIEFEESLDTTVIERPVTPLPDPVVQPDVEPEPLPQGNLLGGDSATRIMPDGRRWNPWRDGPWVSET